MARQGLVPLALAALAALGSAAAWAQASVPPSAPSAASAASAALASAPGALTACRLRGLPQAARCGVLQRPLDPARPQGVMIDVHYAVVPALARRKADDAVFFFAGGPGQSAIELAGVLVARYQRLGERRDLVFVDQRGTGRSAPLKCPDDDERAGLQPLAERSDEGQRLPRLRACRQALQALPHGDLRFYTTEIAMADLDAVRQTLGVARINAIGGSYGTRAVLSYQRQFPQAVRRVVLDGVAPPDMRLPDSGGLDTQATLDTLLAACQAEPACARRHPRLGAQWDALLASVPRSVVLPHPVSGRLETVTLGRDTLLGLLRGPLYQPALAAALPEALAEAAAGRWAPLAALASQPGGPGALATGMHFSVVCAEDLGPSAPPPPPSPLPLPPGQPANRSFGQSFAQMYQTVCADWPRGAVSPAFYSLPPAPAPAWLLSGGLDPVTPPRHGERVAQALGAKARHIVVPNAGHGVTALACMREAVMRFITIADDAEALASRADCGAAMPRPLAYVPPGAAAASASGGAP